MMNPLAFRPSRRDRCPSCQSRTLFGNYGRHIAFECRSCNMRVRVRRVAHPLRYVVTIEREGDEGVNRED